MIRKIQATNNKKQTNLKHQYLSSKQDVWNLGIVIYLLFGAWDLEFLILHGNLITHFTQ